MAIMDYLRKLQDIIMPYEPVEEEVVEKKDETKTTQTQAQEQTQEQVQAQAQNLMDTLAARRAAAVSAAANGTASVNGVRYTAYKDTTARPNLKIVKAPEFVMKVYQPADYSQINSVADDILANRAVVVNYEYVRPEEQLRICDYIEGVCYAVDGAVSKISEKIFLYTPEGISTSDIAALVASVRYH